jgi:hypothetical protein
MLKTVGFLEPVATETEVEYQANEAYESMSFLRQIAVFLLFSASAGLLFLVLPLLPDPSLVQTRPFDIAGNATDIVLQLIYEERKAYQPFVSLSIHYASPKGRPTTLALKYHVEILRGLVQVAQSDFPAKPVKLHPGSSVSLISLEDVDATKFIVSGTVGLVEGSLNFLRLAWRHFNSTFALFVIFIDCILSFVLVMTALSLSFGIASLTKRVPTLASRVQVVTLLVAAVIMLPLPELVYLDIFYWIRSYSWVFQAAYRVMFLVLFDTLCWNLKYREEDEEKWLYKRSIAMFACLFAALAVPEFVTLPDKKLEVNVKTWAPVAGVVLLGLNVVRFPASLGTQAAEFAGAILHIALVLPGFLATAAALSLKATRFDKIEILARMIVVLSYIFVVFIRWPFEGTVVIPQDPGDGGIGVDVDDAPDGTGFQ